MRKPLKQFFFLIGNNCVHFAEMVITNDHDDTFDALIHFGKIFGKKLKRLTCSWKKWSMKNKEKLIEFLQECVNLEEITLTSVYALKENDAHFLPKLKRITTRFQAIKVSEIDFLIRNVRY